MPAISPKCKVILEKKPSCYDFRGIRAWVMCNAWKKMEEEKMPFRDAIRESWAEAKRVCVRE